MFSAIWYRFLKCFALRRTRVLVVVRGTPSGTDAEVRDRVRKWVSGEHGCLILPSGADVTLLHLDTTSYYLACGKCDDKPAE